MGIRAYLLSTIALILLTFDVNAHTHTNTNPFGFIKSLEGSRKGQKVNGLYHLKNYLAKFGYLDKHLASRNEVSSTLDENEVDEIFDESLEKAIRTYQLNYRLNITGHLDATTVKQMMKPRCGSADIINGRNWMQQKNKSRKFILGTSLYAVRGLQWPPSNYQLTYQIEYSTLVSGSENMQSIVTDALNQWAQYSPFSFQEVEEGSESDLKFGFYEGDHGDGYPFDGPKGILGHSFYPTDGRSHYDATEYWSDDPNQFQMDLNSVVLHEIGHLLGLAHTRDANAVMYPTISPGVRKRELQEDDICGIQTIYGSD